MTRNNEKNRLVYSTETGRICPDCGKPVGQCICRAKTVVPATSASVLVSRERRNGKAVTVIKNLAMEPAALTQIGKQLRTTFGTGGTVKEGVLELQGDHCDAVIELLKAQGRQVKRAGG